MFLGPPTALLALLSGGVSRCLRGPVAKIWVAFMVWLLVVTPFSTWKGGRGSPAGPYFATEFSMFFMIAALALTLADLRRLFYAIAVSSGLGILTSRLFGVNWGERLSISFGTLQNPNDYATHLILTIPFLLFVFFVSRSRTVRVLAVLLAPLGVFTIFRTGSRGALLSLLVILGFVLVRATPTQRITIGALLVVLAAVSLAMLPRAVFLRYSTLFGARETAVDQQTAELMGESEGSEKARTGLLKASLSLMLSNPLFGVGPGEFAPAQADLAKQSGGKGAWQVAHNSYTEIGCEAGVPALGLFLAAILAGLYQLNAIYGKARRNREWKIIREMAFCLMLALVGFSICIFFASMEYRFYLPSLLGLIAVFTVAARREMGLASR